MSHPEAIAWLEGRWGHPDELTLPLSERGLLLADGVFETVLVLHGQPQLLHAHLERWQRSAALLHLPTPPDASVVEPLIQAAITRSGINAGALRLNWSRGASARGLTVPAPGGERCWLQLSPVTPLLSPVTVIVSHHERRNASSRLSQAKRFDYSQAIAARSEAIAAGASDALLMSSAGGLCCGTAANLLLHRGGRWLTPALASGCLPGVMRQRALNLGLAQESEAPLEPEALLSCDGAVLLNSLGCRPISQLGPTALAQLADGGALFAALLGSPQAEVSEPG